MFESPPGNYRHWARGWARGWRLSVEPSWGPLKRSLAWGWRWCWGQRRVSSNWTWLVKNIPSWCVRISAWKLTVDTLIRNDTDTTCETVRSIFFCNEAKKMKSTRMARSGLLESDKRDSTQMSGDTEFLRFVVTKVRQLDFSKRMRKSRWTWAHNLRRSPQSNPLTRTKKDLTSNKGGDYFINYNKDDDEEKQW